MLPRGKRGELAGRQRVSLRAGEAAWSWDLVLRAGSRRPERQQRSVCLAEVLNGGR